MSDEFEPHVPEPEPFEVEAQDAPEPSPAPVAAPAWSDDEETEARAFGWKPASEWVGRPPPNGVIDDPRTYMDRALKFTPFRTLRERQEQVEATFAKRIAAVEKRERERYEAQLATIQQQKLAAVDVADRAEYDRLDKQERELAARIAPEAAPETARPRRDITEELPDAVWLKDPVLRAHARDAIEQAAHFGQVDLNRMTIADQALWGEDYVKARWPEHYAAATRTAAPAPKAKASPVDGGGIAGVPSRRDGFEKLPTSAKAAFAQLVKKGIYADTDQDRKEYFNDYGS